MNMQNVLQCLDKKFFNKCFQNKQLMINLMNGHQILMIFGKQ